MTQALEIVTVENVRGYVDSNNVAWINLEDAARGLGFVMTRNDRVTTSGDKYEAVRWNRVNQYLQEFGFSQNVGKESFIPENIFYRLAMKASNAAAQAFQAKIADVILPSIRKHGMYMTPEIATEIAQNPDLLLKVALLFKETKEKLAATEAKVVELQPKADYFDQVLNSKEALNVTAIAKIYGMTGVAFNKLLYEHKIQYPVGNMWVLFCEHMNKGYTVAVTDILKNGLVKTRTKWTHKGKLFIYNTLKNAGIVPEREREEVQMKLFEEAKS